MAKSTFEEDASGKNLPDTKIDKNLINKNIVELISNINKDVSKSEIRRLIKSNAIKIDNKHIIDEKFVINLYNPE